MQFVNVWSVAATSWQTACECGSRTHRSWRSAGRVWVVNKSRVHWYEKTVWLAVNDGRCFERRYRFIPRFWDVLTTCLHNDGNYSDGCELMLVARSCFSPAGQHMKAVLIFSRASRQDTRPVNNTDYLSLPSHAILLLYAQMSQDNLQNINA